MLLTHVRFIRFWFSVCIRKRVCAKVHDDVIKWKHFPRNWPLVWGIHHSPVNFPYKCQWPGALIFSLIFALNKRLSKQSWGWWFETPSHSLWRHCNVVARSWEYGSWCHWPTSHTVIHLVNPITRSTANVTCHTCLGLCPAVCDQLTLNQHFEAETLWSPFNLQSKL